MIKQCKNQYDNVHLLNGLFADGESLAYCKTKLVKV